VRDPDGWAVADRPVPVGAPVGAPVADASGVDDTDGSGDGAPTGAPRGRGAVRWLAIGPGQWAPDPTADPDGWSPPGDPGPEPARAFAVRTDIGAPRRGSAQPSGPRSVRVLVGVVVGGVLVAVAGLALLRPDADGAPGSAVPGTSTGPVTQTGRPARPGFDVRLRDDGTALAVSWSGQRASVVVALSRAGAPAVVLANLPPETVEYVVRDVDPGVDYCVVVGPLSDTATVSAATSVCTRRRGA
jgi:hypothetical protein